MRSPAFSPLSTMKSSPARGPRVDFARLEIAAAVVDKNDVARAGVEYAGGGNRKLAAQWNLQASR